MKCYLYDSIKSNIKQFYKKKLFSKLLMERIFCFNLLGVEIFYHIFATDYHYAITVL